MTKDNESKINPVVKIIVLLLFVISMFCSVFAIYGLAILGSIENVIRYVVIGILLLIDLVFFLKLRRMFNKKKKKKKMKYVGFIAFMIIYSIICASVGCAIFYVYGKLSSMNKSYVTYSSSLVVMKDNTASEIDDISNYTIGILNDKSSPDGYIIPQEIVKDNNLNDENELKEYEDYSSMITDLYVGDVDAILVPSSYCSMFKNISGYENIEEDTKIITSKDKKMKKADTSEVETASSGKKITEPFTILLMGIDSTDDVLQKNAVANGDTLILVTFNPKTLNATMLSIPRDSYVPIACWSNKARNKITHAAGYGNDCMMNTIEEYFDTNIDYYAKINFKGLVKLVDAVGGVDINVEQTLCTDDSSRKNEVCIYPGYQTLNGEQALVYARNRKALANGDFGRNQHQQEIVLALADKVKTITDVSMFMEIFNAVADNLDTNLTTKQMLSFYNVGKDIIKKSLSSDDADIINIQQLYLSGIGQNIYDERMRMVLYNYVPNEDSRKDIITAMKQNLELVEVQDIKEFSFSINSPYEKEVIGKGPYKKVTSYSLLPDFTGDSKAVAQATASRYGISVKFIGDSGYVVSQSYPANKRIDLISGSVELTLSGASKTNTESTTTDKKNDTANEKDNDEDEESEENNSNLDNNDTSDKYSNSTDDTNKDSDMPTE